MSKYRETHERPGPLDWVVINLGTASDPVLREGQYHEDTAAYVEVHGQIFYWADVSGWCYAWEELPWEKQ